MLGKVLALSTLTAFVFLSALMQSTSPSAIHPMGILVVFILLYVLALGVLTFFVYTCAALFGTIQRRAGQRKPLSMKQAYFYASVLALAPVMLVGMKSIGRANVYEVMLVVIFELVACFYISKQR
jgi:hypothetical protein